MKLLGILLSAMLLPTFTQAMDTDSCDSKPLFPFNLRSDQFDDTTAQYYSSIVSKVIQKLDVQENDCDLARLIRKLKNTSLNNRLKGEQSTELLAKAMEIYTEIQKKPEVENAFNHARDAQPGERKALWFQFRREVAPPQLATLRSQLLNQCADEKTTECQDPKKGLNMIEDFFTLNKDSIKEVEFNKEQELIWHACNIVLFTFRQNHRLVSEETDFPTLPKSVAEPSNGAHRKLETFSDNK